MPHLLREFFTNLVGEYDKNKHIVNPHLLRFMRHGLCAEKGTERNSKGHTLNSIVGFEYNLLIQGIRNAIRDFESTPKIINWVIENGGWPFEVKSVKDDTYHSPSISLNIVAGFLARNFELNNGLLITAESFNQTFQELIQFFNQEDFEVMTFLSLHGVSGSIDSFELDENSSIVRADYGLSKLFNQSYSYSEGHYVDMYEGDYVLKINYNIPKKDFLKSYEIGDVLIKKWFTGLLLANVGNIERGKIIHDSTSWPLLSIRAPHLFFYNPNTYNVHKLSGYRFDHDNLHLLSRVTEIFRTLDITKLNILIQHSLDRLTKAKRATSIDDKIVELSLALEYVINTQASEVSLQLRLKGSILYGVPGEEDSSFNNLKEFYNLRSKIVHGNTTIENDDKTAQLLYYSEKILLTILLRLIELTKTYSLPAINKALHKTLYHPKSFEEILNTEGIEN